MPTKTHSPFGLEIPNLQVKAQHVLLLTERIEKAAPADLDPVGRTKLERLGARGREVGVELTLRDRGTSAAVADERNAVIGDVLAMRDTLVAATRVPSELNDRGERAARVLGTLFSYGVPFSRDDAASVYGEAKRMFARIDEERLRDEVADLVHPTLMAACERSVASLAMVMGVGPGEAPPIPNPTAVRDAKRRFNRALAAYVRHLAGMVDEDDPTSVDRYKKAIAPIEAHRAEHGPGPRAPEDEETDVTDVPTIVPPPEPPTP